MERGEASDLTLDLHLCSYTKIRDYISNKKIFTKNVKQNGISLGSIPIPILSLAYTYI